MKVFFTTFFCILSLFLCAQQKAPLKKSEVKNKSLEVKKAVVKKNAFISSRVVDEKGNPFGNVTIEVIDDSTHKVIATSQNESSGHSKISVPPGKKYEIVFSKSGFLFQLFNAVIPDSGGYKKDLKDITLQKVAIGKKIVLNTIFFERNKSTLQKESNLALERIIQLMNDNSSLQIEIAGHTDNIGAANNNRQISEQRAKTIVENLVSRGCDKSRLTYKGYGSSQPVASNTNEIGRKLNNRIELKVLKAEDEHNLVQHQYIYHSALKKPGSNDSTEIEDFQENKDTTIEAVNNGKNIDSTGIEHLQENKDTTSTIVKQVENTDSIPLVTETEHPQENKDTTVTIVKLGESADSTNVEPLQENKETTVTILNPVENPIVTNEEHLQENKDTAATIVKPVETPIVTNEEHLEENKDTIVTAVKKESLPTSIIHSLKMEIKNAGRQISSPFSDYTPLLSADGHMMIFTSRKPLTKKDIQKGKEGLERVYVTYYDDKNDKWLDPKMLGPSINLPDLNNSAVALSNDGQHLLIYHAGTDINANGEIYESQLYTEEWSEPVRLPSPINSEENETSANISPDGRTIYFVSDRKGGLGGKDIWYSTQDEKGKWGEAINMGPSINTAEDEESVFIHPNGNVIFFSSQGHNSMGGYDIFMSVFDEITKTWSPAENLGPSINTPNDEISFEMDANGKTGHYASSKPGGYGGLDIYNITFFEDIMKSNIALLQGRVINRSGNSVGAIISVKNKTTGKISEPVKSNKTTGQYFVSLPPGKRYEIKVTAYGYNTFTESIDIPYKAASEEVYKDIILESKNAFISSRVLDEKGNPINGAQIEVVDKATNEVIAKPKSNSAGYSIVSVPFGKTYDVVFSKSGYLFQSVHAVIPDSVGYERDLKDITLQKVEVGKKIVLNSIFFEPNQSTLRKESSLELQRVIKLLSEMSSLQIEISGHTDNVGAIVYKKQLSEQKAKAVVSNLIIKGIDKNRMKYAGYGAAQPIAINFTEEGRQLNNRIELKVLKVDLAAEQIAEAKRMKETIVTEKQEEEQKETAVTAEKQSESIEPTNDSIKIDVKNIGTQVNTAFSEYAPLISSDGHTMIFTSRRPLGGKDLKKGKEGLENIFVTYYDDKNEKWLAPKILEPTINLPGLNNSALALPNDGQQMLVFHCGADVDATGTIFEHLLYGKDWTGPIRPLPKTINSDGDETSLSISPDGKTYYFVSNRKGGLGGRDIWYSTIDEDGIMGEPVNMGPSINTGEDEDGVFIHPSGNAIFFSSKGHNTMGGFDIFMSVFDETTQTWMEPENLGLPINTYGNDVYFTLSRDGKKGYYASSKPGKIKDLDIYSVEFSEDIIKKNATLLKGRISNKNNNPIGGTIVIRNKMTDKIIDTVLSDKSSGKYFIPLVSGRRYEIEYLAYGYTKYTESIDIPYKAGYNKISKDIVLGSSSAFIDSRVLDEKGMPMSSVQVKVIDDATGLVIAKPLSDSSGLNRIAVPFGKTYAVVFEKAGYFFQLFNVVIPDSVVYEKDLKDIILQKVEVGKKIILSTVSFDQKSPIMRKESIGELQRIAKLMNEMATLQIEIAGHTDSVGTLKINQKLSEQRAKAVTDSLVRMGCNKIRLKFKGYGSVQPIAGNDTDEGRKLNNRIELTVLNVDLTAEHQAEEKRRKDALIPPVKVEKNTSSVNKENQVHSQEQKKTINKPLSERFKKYDKNNDGVISNEELLAAIDSARSELNKVMKPEVTPEKHGEEKRMKETDATPEKKDESINSTKEEHLQENSDVISPVVKKDESINSTKEEHPQENNDIISPPVTKDERANSSKVEPLQENKESIPRDVKKVESDNVVPINKEQNQEQKKNTIKKPIPERFKKYDKDNNGIISYDEILRVIDSFLDEDPKAKGDEKKDESVSELLDYYFEQ